MADTAPPLGLPVFRQCKSLNSGGIVTAMLKRLLPYGDPDVNAMCLLQHPLLAPGRGTFKLGHLRIPFIFQTGAKAF